MENYTDWRAGEVRLTYQRTHPNERKIVCSDDVSAFVRRLFTDVMEHHECMFALSLNRANEIVGWIKISEGGISGTVVDPKIVMQFVLLTNGSALVLAHNHPSGNTKPSHSDKVITRKLVDACNTMDVTLLDHLIMTENSAFSFADNGLIS